MTRRYYRNWLRKNADKKKGLIKKLKKLMRCCKDKRMYERYLSIKLWLEDKTISEIAGIVDRSILTVKSYINVFVEDGIESLKMGQSPGRPSLLTNTQKNQLKDIILNKTPKSEGLCSEMNWNSPLVRELIKHKWGIEYSERGVREVMYSLNLSFTRPTYTLAKADPEKQQKFREDFAILNKRLGDGDIDIILFQDEAMIRDYQAIYKAWFEKGQQKIIPTYGKHQGVKLLGVLNYETGEIFCVEREKYDANVFLEFLKEVLKKYPQGKIAMILDNAKIHHAKLIQPFLEENKERLEFHFLPPYSPNLNCIERFWGWLKKTCICNVFFSSVTEIRDAVQSFVKQVNENLKQAIDRLCLLSY